MAVRTDLGDPIHPKAIAGVDPDPGAVEADALRLYHVAPAGFEPGATPPVRVGDRVVPQLPRPRRRPRRKSRRRRR